MGEEHDSEGGTDCFGGEIVSESGKNCSSVSVTGGNSAPDGLEVFAAVFGDVYDSLSEVPVGVCSVSDSLYSEDGLVFVLVDK